jgi:hypothetical protein
MEDRCRSNFSARTLSQPKVTRRRCTTDRTDRKTYIALGWKVTDPEELAAVGPVPDHETLIEIPEDLRPPLPGGGRARYLEEEGHGHSSSSPALSSASSRSGWRRGNQYNSPREAESPKFVAGEPDELSYQGWLDMVRAAAPEGRDSPPAASPASGLGEPAGVVRARRPVARIRDRVRR